METPKNCKQVLDRYRKYSDGIKWYFGETEELIENKYSYDIIIAYMFSLVEQGHNTALYCGIIKKYKTDSILTAKIIGKHHMKRKEFYKKCEGIFGKKPKKEIIALAKSAEKIRDSILHGKCVFHGSVISEGEKRKAIIDILEYVKNFNEFIKEVADFEPFGKLQGFSGRSKGHKKETTRAILRGLDFDVS